MPQFEGKETTRHGMISTLERACWIQLASVLMKNKKRLGKLDQGCRMGFAGGVPWPWTRASSGPHEAKAPRGRGHGSTRVGRRQQPHSAVLMRQNRRNFPIDFPKKLPNHPSRQYSTGKPVSPVTSVRDTDSLSCAPMRTMIEKVNQVSGTKS